MAEEALQETFSGATKALFGTLGFLLLMFGGEVMLDRLEPRYALGAFLCLFGVSCFYMLWSAKAVRRRLPVGDINAVAKSPWSWLTILLVFVSSISLWHFVDTNIWAAKVSFSPEWLTQDRQRTFKSGALSIINAAGNMGREQVETVSEPQSTSFANALVDLFIVSSFHVRDFGQGDRVGNPPHRLVPGITVVAPVPSLEAESIRVGLERIGIQTRRETDISRADKHVIVEVGPPP